MSETLTSSHLPHVAVVRVTGAGGPYREGDVLSVAFGLRGICRIVRHVESKSELLDSRGGEILIPETVVVSIIVATGTHEPGEELALAFVDPTIARMHAFHRKLEPARAVTQREIAVDAEDTRTDALQPVDRSYSASFSPPARLTSSGVRTRLAWTTDRARRFIQVCDRLFTVDKLGWYRHALVMRMLLPDEIAPADSSSVVEISEHLRLLRDATGEALGRPLVAAFMPNFAVTTEWLDSLDHPTAAHSVSRLREVLLRDSLEDVLIEHDGDMAWTQGIVTRRELENIAATSVEAMLPLLIANVSPRALVTEKLTSYRHALIELFGQTTGSPEAVRLSQMTLPNHILDDCLWQLVSSLSEAFCPSTTQNVSAP